MAGMQKTAKLTEMPFGADSCEPKKLVLDGVQILHRMGHF